ncbi:MAG: hypothetical protein IKQ13_06130 [Treponema sp.]|nr:hypothetical protein [Treponema sp.]
MKFGRFFRPAAFFSFLGMLFPFLLNSCSQISGAINEPVREYFERGSTVTQIVSHEILSDITGAPAATAQDKNGHICVGSASGIKVKLHVNNPMNYTFTEGSNLSYYLVDSTSAALTGADSISLNMTSSTEWELTYPASFLQNADPGKLGAADPKLSKNISVRIDLSHPETGTAFPSYTVPLYCNSVPPLIKDAVTYTKTDATSGAKTYVVAFTISMSAPPTNFDLKYLKIGETSIPITLLPGGSSMFSYAPTIPLQQATVATRTDFQPNGQPYLNTGGTSFYYETNDPVTTDKAYTISLIDEAGLTSSATTAANSYRIADVKLADSSGTDHSGASDIYTPTPPAIIKLGQEEDSSYAKVKIKVPTTACTASGISKSVSGVTVAYTVTNDAGSEIDTGTTTSDRNLNLAPGTYTIACTATKAGYTQSVTTFTVQVIATKLYVKSTGEDIPGNGSKEHPYKTISYADSQFPLSSVATAIGAVRTIYVLDDLGSEQPNETTITNTDCINCQNHTLTDVKLSIGNGCVVKNATIAGIDTTKIIVGSTLGKVLENVILAKTGTDVVAVTGKVTLKNVSSTNNNIINANTIIIKGKVSGLTFKLGTSTKLKIEGSLAGSSNNKIVLDPMVSVTSASPYTFTQDYSTYNGSVAPSTYFKSDDYSVRKDSTSGEAILKVGSGASGDITVYTPDGKLNITVTSGTATSTAIPVTLTVKGILEDSSEVTAPNTTYFTGWDIKLYYEYDYRHSASPSPIITPTTSPSTALNIQNEWPAGNYVIVVNVTFNGTAYCQELIYTKS